MSEKYFMDNGDYINDQNKCCSCSKRTKWIICGLVALPFVVIAILIIACMINTSLYDDPFELVKLTDEEPIYMPSEENDKYARGQRLADAIAIETISGENDSMDYEALEEMNLYLEDTFPEIHANDSSTYVENWRIHGYSRLYRVQGTVTEEKSVYLLLAHMDVVPEGGDWEYDAFHEGIIEIDGKDYIYGRGAIDDKHSVMGIMEALNYFLEQGLQPERTFYIAFGHDEELSGDEGAGHIAPVLTEMLKERGETVDFILDEGMFNMVDLFPGVADPLAYFGVAEKGWAMVGLSVEGVQAHASTPPKETAIGILGNAVHKLEEHRQPNRFGEGPEIDTIRYAAPHATYGYQLALTNLWLTSGIVSKIFGNIPETDAVQRTTTANTIFQAGIKGNVIPDRADSTVNHRLHPADELQGVMEHDRKVINDDRVKVYDMGGYFPPTDISPYANDDLRYMILVNSAVEIWETTHPVPGTMVANTDTKHYLHLCDAVYRFTPVTITGFDETHMFHGLDEKISVEDYDKVVQFYYRLINNADLAMHYGK